MVEVAAAGVEAEEEAEEEEEAGSRVKKPEGPIERKQPAVEMAYRWLRNSAFFISRSRIRGTSVGMILAGAIRQPRGRIDIGS